MGQERTSTGGREPRLYYTYVQVLHTMNMHNSLPPLSATQPQCVRERQRERAHANLGFDPIQAHPYLLVKKTQLNLYGPHQT